MLRFVKPSQSVTKPNVENQSIYQCCTTHKKIKQTILASFELMLFTFMIAALYLGLGANPNRYANRLNVIIVDYDQDIAGNIFRNNFQESTSESMTLNWQIKTPRNDSDRLDERKENFQSEKAAWAIVVLRANTTGNMNDILNQVIHDSKVDTSGLILNNSPVLVVYEEGRNTFTMNNYILPRIRAVIARASAQYGEEIRQTLINNLSSSSSSDPNIQLKNVMHINALLANPLSAQYSNLHPASPFVGHLASTMGYVCLYIFLNAALFVGSTVQFVSSLVGKIHWLDLLMYRIFNGLFQPLMISLIYSLIVLWLFTMDSFGHFIRYWMFNWLASMIYTTTIALFTINFGRFANTFLVFLLVLMLGGSTIQLAIELSPSFYRYGYGLPLYHIINGSRHLLFHSSTNFPLHVGVLLIYNGFLWIALIITSIVHHTKFTLKTSCCFLFIQRQWSQE